MPAPSSAQLAAAAAVLPQPLTVHMKLRAGEVVRRAEPGRPSPCHWVQQQPAKEQRSEASHGSLLVPACVAVRRGARRPRMA